MDAAILLIIPLFLGLAIGLALERRRRLRNGMEVLLRTGEERKARQQAERGLAVAEAKLKEAQDDVERMRIDIGRLKGELGRRKILERARKIVEVALPPDAKVIVVSKGDPDLTDLGGREASHFPQSEDGRYAGYHPETSDHAIKHLEELRSRGARFLLFPDTAFWWFGHYRDFARYLEDHYRLVVKKDGACAIYDLDEPPVRSPKPDVRAEAR
jgi:hypothetical protein